MADTWTDIIRAALIEIGVKEPGEALDNDERDDAFERLQGMFEEWGLEGLLVPGLQTVEHTFTHSDCDYTIGPDQAMDDDDPDIITTFSIEEINALNYRRVGQQTARPMEPTSYAVLSETRRDYRYWPTMYYYDQAYPISRIRFNARAEVGDKIEITGRGHFGNIQVTDNPADILPKGYNEAVLLNLAVKLAPSYGVKDGRSQGLSSQTKNAAMMAKSWIKNRNLQVLEARIDPALRSNRTSLLVGNRMTSSRL